MIANPLAIGTMDPAVGDGTIWIAARFRPALERAGLAETGAVMALRDGRCLRALADRENWYLPPQAPRTTSDRSPAAGMFLKKHHVRTWRSWLRAKRGAGPGETAGRTEAQNIRRLAAEGIRAMDLVAYGERLHADGRLESFVLTEELVGYLPLDDFLLRRFAAQPLDRAAARELARLIRRVAAVARRLHAAGYNHRDLYCCHFFVREPVRGEYEIRLIDLQRVERRQRWRRRWLVKDLAQLAYSAPRDRISCKHKVAFMRAYLGVEKLRPCDKRLVRSVLAKVRRMERKRNGSTP